MHNAKRVDQQLFGEEHRGPRTVCIAVVNDLSIPKSIKNMVCCTVGHLIEFLMG